MRTALLALIAALALTACGEETEQHGGTTRAQQTPGQTAPHVGHGEEIGGSHGEAARGPGASDAHDLKLELISPALRAGQGGQLAFRILDAGGEPITRFEVEHTKQIHLIVVSKDLLHFQHVHPKVSGRGTWRAAVDFQDAGDYRVIADVKHDGRQLALTADLEVDGEPQAVGRPAAEATLKTDRFRAGEPTTVSFDAPDDRQPYLGAAGHLVILKAGDLEYLHVHPHEDALDFETSFPEPGRYVLFLEYRRDGRVQEARFEVTVT